MKFKCIRTFEIDCYELDDEESSWMFEIKKDSLWELRNSSGDYEVMLDDCEDDRWVGLDRGTFKNNFIRILEELND
ncbi:hypothetical protein ACWOFR_03180 [Carnobacterium gallinarum]|uniref:hypothetical protein n=1 Tax=Carnobacterium gallinarum TaxID=2749 RepID=UPI0005501F0C|nr:hypothetical protein [Carnobacterium gallinarum]